MAHILITTQELTGRVNTFCELGRRLEGAGHRVTVSSPVDIADRVRDRGLEFRALSHLRPAGEVGRPMLRVPPGQALRRLTELPRFRRNREEEIEAFDLRGWIVGVESLAPDLVLSDFELPMHAIVARGLGLTVGLLSDQLSLYKRPGLPPLHRNVAPGEGWIGSAMGREALWLQYRAWKWLRFQLLRLFSGGRDDLTVLSEIARRVGYDLGAEAQRYQWTVPFTFRTLPVLTLNARELDFPHQPQENVRYVGPVIDARPTTHLPGEEEERRLQAVLDASSSRTLIYAGFGAYHRGDDSGFVPRVIAAVANEPGWDLVVGLGRRASAADLPDLPANVHVFEWAPQQRILARADLALLHGGITSLNEAIASGVPIVVYPHDYNDTPGYAARIRYHGLGVAGDRAADTPELIRARIHDVLANGTIRANVSAMRNAFAAYGDSALRAVEELLP